MTGQTIILRGPAQRAQAHEAIVTAPLGSTVSVRNDKERRTTQQNRTLHMWFGEIAKQLGDTDANQVKGQCHRRWGLTIKLRCSQFAWVWQYSGATLNYEQQCSLLASGVLNVSSTMTFAELSEYMDAMSQHYRSDGIFLTDPELQKYEGQHEGP